jgi:hypothetical protein
MQSRAQRRLEPGGHRPGSNASRLLKNGAPAHAFTPEERARGGHARAEKIRRRKALREQLGAELEDSTAAEPELLDRALARLDLLISSEDDRVALRAVKEVLDRTLGRPRQWHEHRRSERPDMDAALVAARAKLAALIERHAARSLTLGEQQ